VDALREFVLEQGPSKNVNLMEWDKLWTKNKQKLDPIVPRYMAVGAGNLLRFHIHNAMECFFFLYFVFYYWRRWS
jgi:glutamyl/glutaminyl-tRNA synthetase